MTLAPVMRGLAEREPIRLRPVAEALGLAAGVDDRSAALAAADAVERLALDLGLPTRLSEVHIGEADLEWIAQDTGDTPAALAALRAAL